jgi:predicted kinase
MVNNDIIKTTCDASVPTIVLLCGCPASGKSSWLRTALKDCSKLKDYKVLCTDEWLENKARELNKSYVEIFNEYINEAVKDFAKDLYAFIESGKNIIVDQTNIDEYSRFKKLKLCENYNKIAVYFELELDEAIQRNCNRSRTVPRAVLENYNKNYTRPTLEEGFDIVINGSETHPHWLW